jgi:glyoxylase-like metal-dependent hydrolase (beta-lactamase superfamily II)
MDTKTMEVGPFEVNCTLVKRGEDVWAVDPGYDEERLAAEIGRLGGTLVAILLTHGHFDHIGAIPGLRRRYGDVPVYLHPADVPALTHPLNRMEPFYPPLPPVGNVLDCRTLAGVDVIETPGHTPGGVCYFFPEEKLLLSGDTLFAGSVGRTDFPGGDLPTLQRSLAALCALPDETRVIPGHGPETTIGAEKSGNPFLR